MGRLRWKREKRETGLAAIAAGPRGYFYHDGDKKYATVNAHGGKWYWVAGWNSNVPHKNTYDNPCRSIEEAKQQASEYVKKHLK